MDTLKWAMVSVLIAPAALALGVAVSGERDTIGPVQGVRLGLAPADARARLEVGVRGAFRSTTRGDDLTVDWAPRRAPGAVSRARMEFHGGELVALRLALSSAADAARGPALELSDVSVLTREAAPDGSVRLTWLARDCPTHAAEARRRSGG